MQKSLVVVTSRIKIALAQPKLKTREGRGRSFETMFVIEGWMVDFWGGGRNGKLREANSREAVVNRLARTLSRARTMQHVSTEGTTVSPGITKGKAYLPRDSFQNDIDSAWLKAKYSQGRSFEVIVTFEIVVEMSV